MTGKVLVISQKGDDLALIRQTLKEKSLFIGKYISWESLFSDIILSDKPDVIVLNLDEPNREALSTYERIISEDASREIPILLLLDERHLSWAEDKLRISVQDICIKPLRASEFVARVTLLYKRSNRIDDASIIRCGELELDIARYEVRVLGSKVDLTYTEYQLLKFFVTHPGHVFNREVLLNKVWGYDYFGGARTVDVHVRRLRAKIEVKKQRFIETVRHIGYRFISHDE